MRIGNCLRGTVVAPGSNGTNCPHDGILTRFHRDRRGGVGRVHGIQNTWIGIPHTQKTGIKQITSPGNPTTTWPYDRCVITPSSTATSHEQCCCKECRPEKIAVRFHLNSSPRINYILLILPWRHSLMMPLYYYVRYYSSWGPSSAFP